MEDQFSKAVDILKNGGLVAFPTDTVYGLGSDSRNPNAIRRVFQTKNRPLSLPLPLLAADIEMLREAAKSVPEAWLAILERFIPGPLTIVVERASWVPDLITAGGSTVAIRVPNHPVPQQLAKGLSAPIVGTSANYSGTPNTTTTEVVREQMGNSVDLILEGHCIGGLQSTIVDLSGLKPRILREGAVPSATLDSLLT